jgi:hypothetical protein
MFPSWRRSCVYLPGITLRSSLAQIATPLLVHSDLSCGSDSDCELVRTGEVCNGQCSCGSTPINAAAAARFQADTASLTLEACPCADPGEARCLGGQCTLCGLGPNQSAGCGELGTVEDAGI